MTPEQVFSITNAIAVVGWILLAILPGRAWVTSLITSTVLPVFFAVIYAGIIVTMFAGAHGSFSTVAGVQQLFANPWLLVAGWLHYLAFDLLIGTWEVRDARQRRIPHLLVVPCLFMTLMFGPVGWLIYRAIRAGYGAARTQGPGLPGAA